MNELANTDTKDQKKSVDPSKFAIHLLIDFHEICIVSAALPLVTLFLCFVTAYIFQAEEVHETHCRVYNVIPSISAITGVSPQRYFWRICVALHIGPRFPIAAIYRNYYRNLIVNLSAESAKRAHFLINLVFWLNTIEVASLCGVTYISNKENYRNILKCNFAHLKTDSGRAMHEKIFITFMIVSLCHMLATIKLFELLYTKKTLTEKQAASLKWKKLLFVVSIISTIGLILFFLKHRLLCHEMAFSWFALCEYVIASANMGFHCTTMLDFPSEYFIVAEASRDKLKEHMISPIVGKVD